MTELTTLPAKSRDRAGKGAARGTRRNGFVPGVIYGAKQAPTLIAIEPKYIIAEMHKPGFSTRLFDITVEGGKTERALVKDVQLHPISDMPIHIDFLRISKESVVHVHVPVHFINELASPGLKRGGVLNVVRHDIEVVCSPDNIPKEITLDLTGMDIGDAFHIEDVKLPAGVKPVIHERNFTVASIAPPTVVRAETSEAEGGAA